MSATQRRPQNFKEEVTASVSSSFYYQHHCVKSMQPTWNCSCCMIHLLVAPWTSKCVVHLECAGLDSERMGRCGKMCCLTVWYRAETSPPPRSCNWFVAGAELWRIVFLGNAGWGGIVNWTTSSSNHEAKPGQLEPVLKVLLWIWFASLTDQTC